MIEIRISEINAMAARLEVIAKRVAYNDIGAMECNGDVQSCADELLEIAGRLEGDSNAEPPSDESSPKPGWISVDDRLPEAGQRVAFVVAGGYFAGCVLAGRPSISSGAFFRIPGGTTIRGTHWYPLPDPHETPVDEPSRDEHDILGGMT